MLEQAHTPGAGGGLLTGPPPPQLQLTVSVPAVTTPIPKLGCVRDADTIRVTALSSDVSALKPGNLIPGLLDCLAPSGLANINMVTRLGHPPLCGPRTRVGRAPHPSAYHHPGYCPDGVSTDWSQSVHAVAHWEGDTLHIARTHASCAKPPMGSAGIIWPAGFDLSRPPWAAVVPGSDASAVNPGIFMVFSSPVAAPRAVVWRLA